MSLSPAIASSMSLIELSRATANGMKEWGNSTVSRSGSSGTSAGTTYVRSPFVDDAWTSVMTTPDPSKNTTPRKPRSSAGPARWECPRCVREVRPPLVQVQQEARRPALRQLSLPAFGQLTRLFAVLAPDGERQGPEPALRDLVAALEAVTVGPFVESRQRFLDFVACLRFHLDQRQFDVVLDVRFRRLGRVEDARALARGPFRPDIPHLLLHFGQDLATPILQDTLQLGVELLRPLGLPVEVRACLHDPLQSRSRSGLHRHDGYPAKQ